ncbi:MAG: TIM barrel protein [Candidatus Hodarchaeota archaeon]
MLIAIGVTIAASRFISQNQTKKRFNEIKNNNLNAVEFGLLNCVIGRSNIPGTIPYPSEIQSKEISSLFSPQEYYTSVHGPYRISATSDDPKKLKYSKSNLSATLKVTDWLEGRHVTFHGGSFKRKHNNTHVRNVLLEWEEWRQQKGYRAKLAPEVGGKYNSFADFFTLVEIAGTIDNCLITWDISHDFARGGNVTTEAGILKRLELIDQTWNDLSPTNRLPMHFSGMVVGKAGEKHHTLLDKGTGAPWKFIFSILKEQKYLDKVSLVCESKVPKNDKIKGNAISDAIRAKKFLESDELEKEYKGKPGHLDYYFT